MIPVTRKREAWRLFGALPRDKDWLEMVSRVRSATARTIHPYSTSTMYTITAIMITIKPFVFKQPQRQAALANPHTGPYCPLSKFGSFPILLEPSRVIGNVGTMISSIYPYNPSCQFFPLDAKRSNRRIQHPSRQDPPGVRRQDAPQHRYYGRTRHTVRLGHQCLHQRIAASRLLLSTSEQKP